MKMEIEIPSMNINSKSNRILERFGFSFERGSAHNSRTIMLSELQALFTYVDSPDAQNTEYLEAIQLVNCLGKRSGKTRQLTYRHLVDLYSLNPHFALFRALRYFWRRDVNSQPLLAVLCAYSRDPIFRASSTFLLAYPEGSTVKREALEMFIEAIEPGRFSEATLKSTAQNINASWTQSGHLEGRVKKIRKKAEATTGALSYALFLGYLKGLRGESLFKSEFTKLLDCNFDRLIELAEDSSRRGWISMKRVGNVVEVLFPNLITAQELEWLREQS